jgi:hypothetical protein
LLLINFSDRFYILLLLHRQPANPSAFADDGARGATCSMAKVAAPSAAFTAKSPAGMIAKQGPAAVSIKPGSIVALSVRACRPQGAHGGKSRTRRI